MGLRPTHRDESPFLATIDSKRVMRDFRRSVFARRRIAKTSESFAVEGTLRHSTCPGKHFCGFFKLKDSVSRKR
jgi:hypothetical protein